MNALNTIDDIKSYATVVYDSKNIIELRENLINFFNKCMEYDVENETTGTAESIIRKNNIPVFCDEDPYTIDMPHPWVSFDGHKFLVCTSKTPDGVFFVNHDGKRINI